MKDHELLELAAKAAGMETQWEQPRGAKSGWLRARVPGQMAFPIWRPLDDDGDALRLAVCLALTVIPAEPDADAVASRAGGADPWIAVETGSDKYAATRRAIVHAAAAIQLAKVPA